MLIMLAESRHRRCKLSRHPANAGYERFGFIGSPSDPFHLFVLIKDLRRIASA
jgi:hypothetical protein